MVTYPEIAYAVSVFSKLEYIYYKEKISYLFLVKT